MAAEQRARREGPPVEAGRDDDGMEPDVRADAARRGQLKRACQHLVGQADRLERSLDERTRATARAKVDLRGFKEALQTVSRTAQALVNGGASTDNGE